MIQFIAKILIKDYQNIQDQKVRQSYGMLTSIICIILNIFLAIFKISIGIITNSITMQADGFNNLSDVGSNLASLLGFKLATKHPDEDHPYGHGRYEYIAGLLISFIIFFVGFSTFLDAFVQIFEPVKSNSSIQAIFLLILGIIIKLWMVLFTKKTAQKISSTTLEAVSKDSLNDVIATSATLVSLIIAPKTTLPIDGIFGCFVSLFILKAGYDVFHDTINPLLGHAPNKAYVKEIEDYILSFNCAQGIHDLAFHDYGPGRQFLTLHVEVDCHGDMMNIHEQIDIIERSVKEKFNIVTTIHMDPVDYLDEATIRLKKEVEKIVKTLNEHYTIHDFRSIIGITHTNIIFDVVIPYSDHIEHKVLKKTISEKIVEKHPECTTIIQIEHNYI